MPQLNKIAEGLRRVALWCERLLAVAILVGIGVFAFRSVQVLSAMDWGQSEAIYELIYRVLLVVIGLELIRTLLTHELGAILELLAFVVARKTLKPDLNVIDIFLSVVAFVLLLAARRHFLGECPQGDPVVPLEDEGPYLAGNLRRPISPAKRDSTDLS